MPVAEFPGTFGWGYDGVDLFAPSHLYGTPDDLRRFVDRAHALGLGVILDVVYNHLGPDGNYLKQFSDHYFTDRYTNDWGEALNFDDPHCGPVRDFFLANARLLDRRSSTSTASASTPRRTSTTLRRSTSWPSSPAPCARRARRSAGAPPI